MNSIKGSIESLIMGIKEVSDLIYQQNSKQGYQKFEVILDKISNVSEQLFSLFSKGELNDFDVEKYVSVLTEAMNAMETRDDVLLADILNYDLSDQLEEIITHL